MSLHKLTAGNGYTYLTRQVAAADATDRGRTSLGDFYAQKGESPGVWVGSGLSGLAGVDAGGHVSGEQMLALFGEGRHPDANKIGAAMIAAGHCPTAAERASALGRRYSIYDQTPPFRVEVEKACVAHNTSIGQQPDAPIPPDVRARVRTDVGARMFTDTHGRSPADSQELHGFMAVSSRRVATAVAGYDLTFSPVKSVSALWAIAPPRVAAQIQEAQNAAVTNTLTWLERDASFTRVGSHRACQIVVTALIGTAFTHRDARSGDPDLHTHVAISNKVQSLNGAWRALDGRVLFKARVAASERYNTRIEAELSARLGVRFRARAAVDPSRRPVREVVGVDPRLNQFWSSRRADIEVRLAVLSAAFQVDRARPPTAVESRHLAQRATLETRAHKHSARSDAEQRATWSAQAKHVLGGDAAVQQMIIAALPGHRQNQRATGQRVSEQTVTGQTVTGQWVEQMAAQTVAMVSGSRSTWQMWHVRAEAERRARAAEVALVDLDGAVDRVVARALSPAHSVPVGGPKHIVEPDILRRDGSSVYTVPGAQRFTSQVVIDAEAALLRPVAAPAICAPPHRYEPPPNPGDDCAPEVPHLMGSEERDVHPNPPLDVDGAVPRSDHEPPRRPTALEVEGYHEALFHCARQRQYAPAPDLDAIDTDCQLAEANRWDHATVPQARLLELNAMAADFFSAGYAGSWGPGYVSSRLDTDLADHRAFRAGYAPAGWTNLTDHLRRLGVRDNEILAAGLGRVATTGRIIDQFRDRLVLPIRNGDQIHGFIGRRKPTLTDADNAGPKYLNTPHTDLFDKGAQLFGLSEGRAALDVGASPVLVEGFFDAIAVTLAGAGRYVGVAPLGTSLTATQANQLRTYIGAERREVAVATDADLAGQIGAQRAFWMLTARGDSPRLVAMPEGQDPAAVLQHAGPAVLRAALDDAQPLARLLLDERLTHLGEELPVLSECAVVIAAQPPHTWMEQIEYLTARTDHRPEVVQQAVADAAQRWTLDPLGSAQEQIGDLAAVQARLQRDAHAPLSADRPCDLVPAAGVAAKRGRISGQSGEPKLLGATAVGGTATQPPLQAWRKLAHSIDARLTAGEDWPVLWRAIQEADAAGCDVAGQLSQLGAEGQLAGEHSATELAYRLRAATQTFSQIEPALGLEQKQAAVSSGAGAQPNTATSRRPTSPRVR